MCTYCQPVLVVCVCFAAPSVPRRVVVSCNVTDSVIVQWARPKLVFNRVDRYYVHYQAASQPKSYEMVIDDVTNSYDFHEVNSFFTPLYVFICSAAVEHMAIIGILQLLHVHAFI